MSLTFIINNQWGVLHQINITTQKSGLTSLVSISGSYRNVAEVVYPFKHRVVFGDSYDLGSITIDGERYIQVDKQRAIFERVKRCLDQGTGIATFDKMNKKLVIETGQGPS